LDKITALEDYNFDLTKNYIAFNELNIAAT
jgi:hypothetical protein